MKHTFCLVFAVLLLTACSARDMSDLLTRLRHEKNDSLKVQLYKDIFDHYQYEKPDSARYYLQEGLTYFKARDNKKSVAVLTVSLGQLESAQGRQAIAKARFRDALALFGKLNDRNGLALANNSIGVAEGRVGNHLEATKYFIKALKEFETTNNTKGIINTYVKLGTVNDLSNNLDKALEYYNKGLQLSLKRPGEKNTAYLYNNIGVTFCRQGRVDTGIVCFKRALALSDSFELHETNFLALMHLGNAYKDLEKYDVSLNYYDQALKLSSLEAMPEHHAHILLNIATLKGLTDHKSALTLLTEAEAIATKIGQKSLKLEVMEEMIRQHRLLGDYKTAYSTLEKADALEDSIFSLEKATEIANLTATHDLELSNQKVSQLEAAQQKNKLQKNIIIAIAAGLALSLLALSMWYQRSRKLNMSLLESQAELRKSGAIKDRLFSIIGHDLRGPIANIPMVIELYQNPNTTDEEKAYMRDLVVENSMASLDTLDKLLHWGKAQIKGTYIQQKAFNATRSIEHQISLLKGMAANKGIDIINNTANDTTIYADEDHFNFVVRNLLSNAIKFSHGGSEVVISSDRYRERGFTIFSVKDNGIGIEQERLSKIFEAFSSSTLGTNNETGTSIGLMLCEEFVTENGGKIWVESEPGRGTTFSFTLKNS